MESVFLQALALLPFTGSLGSTGADGHNVSNRTIREVEFLRCVVFTCGFLLHIAVVGIHSDDPSNGTLIEVEGAQRSLVLQK